MYIPKEYSYSLPFEIVMFIYSIFAIILNIVVIYIVNAKLSKEKAIDIYLITCIAIFDVLFSISLDINLVAKWNLSMTPLEYQESTYCSFSSILNSSTVIVAIALSAQLSIVRYLTIVKSFTISNIKVKFLSIVIILLTFFVFTISGTMGVSRLMPSGLICIPTTENHDSIEHKIYATVVFVIIYPIALCIPIFYGLISIHYYKLNQRFKECSGSLRQRVAFYKSKHIACLFLFTMLYLICMFPEFIILVIEAASYYQRSYTVDCISFLLFYSGAVVNPLFVLTLLPDSRKKLVKLFKKERNGDGHHQTVSAFQYPLSNDLIGRTPLPIS